MKLRVPPVEQKRIQNINFVMADLHSSLNNIYELLMDKEYTPLRGEVNLLSKKLKSVSESVTDEL
ncbi:MAG: hypothetical protein ACR2M9_03550 [Cyanophyceae cyanobacterium]|tara:strand:+ start:458 stop:652 length:195 start_codon:yes stop_codon:yes gene_type:complete